MIQPEHIGFLVLLVGGWVTFSVSRYLQRPALRANLARVNRRRR